MNAVDAEGRGGKAGEERRAVESEDGGETTMFTGHALFFLRSPKAAVPMPDDEDIRKGWKVSASGLCIFLPCALAPVTVKVVGTPPSTADAWHRILRVPISLPGGQLELTTDSAERKLIGSGLATSGSLWVALRIGGPEELEDGVELDGTVYAEVCVTGEATTTPGYTLVDDPTIEP